MQDTCNPAACPLGNPELRHAQGHLRADQGPCLSPGAKARAAGSLQGSLGKDWLQAAGLSISCLYGSTVLPPLHLVLHLVHSWSGCYLASPRAFALL